MMLRSLLLTFTIFCSLFITAQTADSRFENLGGIYGGGIIRNFIISTNANTKAQKIYISSAYDTFEIASVDPLTNKTVNYHSPLSGETQAFGLVEASDKKIYIGTSPNAHLMRINEKENKIDDLGKAIAGAEYIWDLASYKNKVYGCTYPNAKLFSYDFTTRKFEDLGRMASDEMYAKSMISDGLGNLYIGVGYVKGKVKKYNISSKKITDISLGNTKTDGKVPLLSKGTDNEIYVEAGDTFGKIVRDNFVPIEKNTFQEKRGRNFDKNQKIEISEDYVKLKISPINTNLKPTDNRVRSMESAGKLLLFRLGLGPDNKIYASTALPLYLAKFNENSKKFEKIDWLGNGEVYSFLSYKANLFLFTYASLAEIMAYNPQKPIERAYNPQGNPYLILSDLIDGDWRPFDAIEIGGKIYIASMNGYGKEGGSLTVFNPDTKKIENIYNVVDNQSITSLCKLENGNLAGGTFIQGGYGTSIVADRPKIFLWDTRQNKKLFETDFLKGIRKIDGLIAEGNKVFGIASSQFFVYDLNTRKMIVNKPHYAGNLVYNGIIRTKDNSVYGVSEDAVFKIDTRNNELIKMATTPDKIAGGIVEKDGFIYMFSKDNDIIRFKIN